MTRIENIRPILNVADLEASVAYYTQKLGFTENWREGGMSGVGRDGCEIMLCHGAQGHAGTWLWIGVEDAGAYFEEVSARDVNVRLPLTNYPYAYEFDLFDPDGHVLRFGSEPRQDIPYVTG
jgi:catechol 2,3-dioxygenase-like lactoylglutathione lyase family enzyme